MTPSNHWRTRYEAAYRTFFERAYPAAFAHGGHIKTTFPDTRKSNGLTNAVIKFLTWRGHRATRISTTGRVLQSKTVGVADKFIQGTTRKGTADISATLHGRSVMFEVKVGRDTPSHEQLREQKIEEAAGGKYYFIHSMDEFFEYYDQFILSLGSQFSQLR